MKRNWTLTIMSDCLIFKFKIKNIKDKLTDHNY